VRQPSIKDIARLANVSHPTVSRALQNSPLVNLRRPRESARSPSWPVITPAPLPGDW